MSGDTIVDSIVEKFLRRSQIGKQKYGTTLDRDDLSPMDWINHAQEEHMDAILYLEKLKKELNKMKIKDLSDSVNKDEHCNTCSGAESSSKNSSNDE